MRTPVRTPPTLLPYPGRALARLFVVGLVNFAWAVAMVVLIRAGVVHPWLAWVVPVPIGAGLGSLVLVAVLRGRLRRAARDHAQAEEAARTMRTAPGLPHAPVSLAAPARDPAHRRVDLLARDDR